jgi:Fe-S-cluster containining protein
MGQAKRRAAEIARLKSLPPDQQQRWREARNDEAKIVRGIDVDHRGPEQVLALAKLLHGHLETGKSTGNLDEVVAYLNSKVDLTVSGLGDVPVACKQGCSHCCNIWVSASPPEIFSLARIATQRGESAIVKIREANAVTKQYAHEVRPYHPFPCPFLSNDQCSVYEKRPHSCRLASSADAGICFRSYTNLTDEHIPTPAVYLMARDAFSSAIAFALRKAALETAVYELNSGLVCALDRPDAEQAWLAGEDIFSTALRDPVDLFSNPSVEAAYHQFFS